MWREKTAKQMRYNRDNNIRKKITLFSESEKSGNVSLACKILGYKRSFHYYWWSRFEGSGYDIKSLKEKSRRPKRYPKMTNKTKVKVLKRLCKKTNYGPVRLSYFLAKDYQTCREVKDGLGAYFDFYNNDRYHQSLGYKTPSQIHWS